MSQALRARALEWNWFTKLMNNVKTSDVQCENIEKYHTYRDCKIPPHERLYDYLYSNINR